MANFWRIWGSLIQRVLGIVGSQASLLALAFVFAPQPLKLEGWPAVVAAICSIVTLIAVYFEISSEKRPRQLRHVFALSDKERIKIYMRDWIRQAGRVAIWTRDMSWAHDAETMGLLAAKAADHSLILCMPELIPAAQALKELGADTYIYGARTLASPASRFTIAYFGNGGSRVAIGKANGNIHVIEELDSSDPAYALASDLVQLARRLSDLV